MSTYLLLRDNKESGPYSKEELVTRGLKAYDLIWVQGKSAAWRYPSEISELKPHAPVVEEQPFDRFFKKEEQPGRMEKEKAPSGRRPAEQPTCNLENYQPRVKPSSNVFVTLPNGRQARSDGATPPSPTSTEPSPPTITVSENPAAAQIKYSQPLDEIKEMYVKTLQERKQKLAFRSFLMQSLRKASVILLLISVGVLAGFMIRSNKETKAAAATAAQPMQQTSPSSMMEDNGDVAINNEHLPENNPSAPSALGEKEKKALDQLVARSISEISNEKKASKQLLGSSGDANAKKIYEFQNSLVDPASGERSRRSRTTEETASVPDGTGKNASNKEAGSHVSAEREVSDPLVTVKSNDYHKVAFGGIRNLELTVANHSDKHLDEVLVELQYLKPSELPLRTENIRFTSIAPNSTSTIRIPDTNRGIKVSYRIVNITR